MKLLRHPRVRVATLALVPLVVPSCATAAAAGPARVENVQLETRAGGPSLESAIHDAASQIETLWLGYSVPAQPGEYQICCSGHWKRQTLHGACRLENSRRGQVFDHHSSKPIHLERNPAPELNVLMRLDQGLIDRIETFSEGCLLDAGGLRLVWLEGVGAGQSVRLLDDLVSGRGALRLTDRDDGDEALTALAFHAEPTATPALEKLARVADDDDLREEAVFWLGVARERPGYEALVRLARDLEDDDVREHVTFALSQSPVPEAEQALIDMARDDHDPDVRGQALFWLGQEGGDRAAQAILAATREDSDEDVREEAVFALSQLPDGQGIDTLLSIARDPAYPTGTRKHALFWLGQSEDPRAIDLLAEMLR